MRGGRDALIYSIMCEYLCKTFPVVVVNEEVVFVTLYIIEVWNFAYRYLFLSFEYKLFSGPIDPYVWICRAINTKLQVIAMLIYLIEYFSVLCRKMYRLLNNYNWSATPNVRIALTLASATFTLTTINQGMMILPVTMWSIFLYDSMCNSM